ncbi:hypothetical protein VTL71DRAFT_10987 [Oculimacula yallundae]|uniref:Uncharacterized protein n=1 Tax=Oculimacula yallundae TaxID=86028 RepID=A0ABR4CUQ1_9HELO
MLCKCHRSCCACTGTRELNELVVPDGVQVNQYDGPIYTMTDEDKADRLHAIETNTSWTVPDNMPRITLEAGTVLDFGQNNSTLSKRSGNRWIVPGVATIATPTLSSPQHTILVVELVVSRLASTPSAG